MALRSITHWRLTPAGLVIALVTGLVCCSSALADETVQVCGSYANNVFQSSSVAGISATGRCPTPSYNGGGFGLFNTGNTTRGQTGRWQTTVPGGLELVGATASQLVSTGVNDGADYGGGFYWAGGGVGTNDQSPSTLGMAFSLPSTYFGMQLVCGKGTCKAPALMAVGAFALYVRETSGPTFNSPSGLWQTTGWIRGAWPFVLSGDSPSGLCSLSASLNGQLIDTTTSGQDVSSWHQCAAPPISQAVDTSRYSQGAVALTLSASDAAGVPASLSKTVYIDNSTPTVSLAGPADAPSTAGTQYVTATGGGSPSGIADIVCTVDGGPAQTFAGASAQVPVSGIGPHVVSCFAENNAVDPSGAHGRSTTASSSLKIGQPTEVGIAFDKLVGLRCHSARVRVTIPGRWITVRRHGKRVKVKTHAQSKLERVQRCHPRTVRRRTIVFVRVRRHGHLVKLKRVKYVRVVVPPHLVAKTARAVPFGHGTTVNGWLGTSSGTALAGQVVHVLAAPNNGSNAFTEAATVTTTAAGFWTAQLPPGPSRVVEAVFDGSPTTESSSSGQVRVVVPAMVRIAIRPRIVPWGSEIHVTGRVLGGYVPTERPAEAGELASDGDRNNRAALAALSVEPLPDVVQPSLGLPGDLDDVGRLSVLAAAERLSLRRCAAIVPRSLDQQPAGVPGPGLADGALPAFLAAGVLGWGQAEVAHQLPGLGEPLELGDLGAEPDRRERVDPAQAAQPGDRLLPRRAGDQLGDDLLERVAADHDRVDRAEVLKQRHLRAALPQVELRQPSTVSDCPGAGGVLIANVVTQQQLREPLPGAHQITAHRFPGPNHIA
jgi:hypothetical protein